MNVVTGGWSVERIRVRGVEAYAVQHGGTVYARFLSAKIALSTMTSLNGQEVDLDGLAEPIHDQTVARR